MGLMKFRRCLVCRNLTEATYTCRCPAHWRPAAAPPAVPDVRY